MTATTSTPTQTIQPKRFTVQDYHRLVDLGFLGEDDHVELIRGVLMQLAAKGARHETCIRRLLRELPLLVGDRATVQCQSPIVVSVDGEPEPDFAILHNRDDDYATAHPTPTDTLLVIEVADSSLDYDRTVKLPLYAEAAIPYYWLFNLVDRYLETYSDPAQVSPTQHGYLNRRIIPAQGIVPLACFPEVTLDLNRVFPQPVT